MSYRSTADEKRDEAKNGVDAATKAIAAIVVERCEGYDSFTDVYRDRLKDLLGTLIDARNKL